MSGGDTGGRAKDPSDAEKVGPKSKKLRTVAAEAASWVMVSWDNDEDSGCELEGDWVVRLEDQCCKFF